MNISGIDHIELYVGDARQAAFYLCTAFGFKVCGQGGPETGLEDRRSLLLRQGDIQVVLTTGLVPDHPATEYVRRTLFLEIIERRGALTFGSGNVKALYEAKRGELSGTTAG